MKTTIDIPDKLLRDAMRHTKAKTKREAVLQAVSEMNRRHYVEQVINLFGRSATFLSNEDIERGDAESSRAWR